MALRLRTIRQLPPRCSDRNQNFFSAFCRSVWCISSINMKDSVRTRNTLSAIRPVTRWGSWLTRSCFTEPDWLRATTSFAQFNPEAARQGRAHAGPPGVATPGNPAARFMGHHRVLREISFVSGGSGWRRAQQHTVFPQPCSATLLPAWQHDYRTDVSNELCDMYCVKQKLCSSYFMIWSSRDVEAWNERRKEEGLSAMSCFHTSCFAAAFSDSTSNLRGFTSNQGWRRENAPDILYWPNKCCGLCRLRSGVHIKYEDALSTSKSEMPGDKKDEQAPNLWCFRNRACRNPSQSPWLGPMPEPLTWEGPGYRMDSQLHALWVSMGMNPPLPSVQFADVLNPNSVRGILVVNKNWR